MSHRVLLSRDKTFEHLQQRYPEKDIPAMLRWLSLAGAATNVCLVDEMFDIGKINALLGDNPCKEPDTGDIVQTFQNGTYLIVEKPIHREDVVKGVKVKMGVHDKYRICDISITPINMSDAIYVRTSNFDMDNLKELFNEIRPHLVEIERLYDTITTTTEKDE